MGKKAFSLPPPPVAPSPTKKLSSKNFPNFLFMGFAA